MAHQIHAHRLRITLSNTNKCVAIAEARRKLRRYHKFYGEAFGRVHHGEETREPLVSADADATQ